MGRDKHTVAMTCIDDGRLHLVTEDALVAGVTAHTGRYRAVCGHEVAAAAMVSPPGPACPSCSLRHAQGAIRARHRRRWRPRHLAGASR